MDEHLELKRLDARDLESLVTCDPRLDSNPVHRAHIRELLSADLSWAVAIDGAVAGFAILTRHFYGYPFVDLLLVAEGHRRKGVGRALIAACEAKHDADRIFTSTNESNTAMRRLLVKADWLTAGVIEYLDPGDPELVFVKLRA